MPDADIQLMAALGRLSLALALGSAIGFERQWHQKMAGLRTKCFGRAWLVRLCRVLGHGRPGRSDPRCGSGRLRHRVPRGRHHLARGRQCSRAQHRCDALVFGDGRHLRGRRLLGAECLCGGIRDCNQPPPSAPRAAPQQPNATAGDVETHYTVEITCKGVEVAHIRSLLLHALSQAGLGLRRIDSEEIPDTPKVAVTAQAVAAKRKDGALEQIVGRLSLEPYVTAATWQVNRAILEALWRKMSKPKSVSSM
jgi:putative Mg2+ transporter-C (MgtC) family protein